MSKEVAIPEEVLMSKIHLIRGRKVMLDRELAELYGVTTGNLNKAVNRHIKRFPDDFMFQLTKKEYDALRFQIGILKRGQHAKYLPKAFTREGISMLSGILNSDWAITVNIQVMRTFWKMEDMLLTHKDLLLELEEIRQSVKGHGDQISLIFEYLKQFEQTKQEALEYKNRPKIGFKRKEEE
ncbi:MAG: ORF6N domain-containing protein [Flavobacteriales bacterium]|nr:ORF6N domain-containing protein [Flavobacteriales bacterium]